MGNESRISMREAIRRNCLLLGQATQSTILQVSTHQIDCLLGSFSYYLAFEFGRHYMLCDGRCATKMASPLSTEKVQKCLLKNRREVALIIRRHPQLHH